MTTTGNALRTLTAFIVLALAGAIAQAQGTTGAAEAWAKAATPGAEHKLLAARAGKWTSTIKTWADPKQPPYVSQANHDLTMVAGGRFLREEVRADASGIIYEGTGYTGYDNLQKKYVAVWMDTLGTAMRISTGTADGKTLNLAALGVAGYRSSWKMSGSDKMLVEMFGPGADGKEAKIMEIAYQRAK